MKKGIIVAMLSAFVLVFGLAACSFLPGTQSNATYESILNDYTVKMQQETPKLIDEYNKETAGKSDINQNAQISNEKISKLAQISTEGMGKMAELMNKNKDSYDKYQEWANKLTNVYQTEAQKITDAYMASAM